MKECLSYRFKTAYKLLRKRGWVAPWRSKKRRPLQGGVEMADKVFQIGGAGVLYLQ